MCAHILDFSDLPDLASSKICTRIDDTVAKAIAMFPQTAERALCATRFCWWICSVEETWEEHIALRQGFMRASLAEFVGMEEALERDLIRLAIPANPIRANSGQRP